MGFKGFGDAKIKIFHVSGGMIFKVLFLVVFLLIFFMSVMLAKLKYRAPVDARAQFLHIRIFQVVS